MTWFIFILGAMAGGFCTGTHGLCICLNCHCRFWVWIWHLSSQRPLVVFASVWSHLISLKSESAFQLDKSLVTPYILAGLIGVPLGTYLLDIIQAHTLKLVLGIFLIFWCPLMLLNPRFASFKTLENMPIAVLVFLGVYWAG